MNQNQCTCTPQCSTTFLRQIQCGRISNEVGCLHCINKHGDNAMLLAARHGHIHLLKTLHEQLGLHMETSNCDGKRPLHEAAQNGHVECAQYLIEQGAEVDSLKRADWFESLDINIEMSACFFAGHH